MLMMLPFEAPTIFEGIHKSYFRMPRVVKDQRAKFENDELFRQLSHESAVKYTGFKDRPVEERQMKFIANCQEGHTEVSVVQSGNQFTLMFNPGANPAYNNEGCDFDKELGKVHIKSGFILNGVCVIWRGWIDLQRLEGFGCLEFDEYRAYLEDAMLKQQIDKQQQQVVCNNSANTQPHPPPPLGRLNHLGGPPPPPGAISQSGAPHPPQSSQTDPIASPLQQSVAVPPVSLSQAAAAAAVAASLAPPTSCGMTPTSLGAQMLAGGPQVSLADSYGNAAIAAAAAAAFHQALSVGVPPMVGPNGPFGGGPVAALGLPTHLQSYTNGVGGSTMSNIAAAAAAAAVAQANHSNSTPPPLVHHMQQQQQTTTSMNGATNNHQNLSASARQNSNARSTTPPEQHHHQRDSSAMRARHAAKRGVQDDTQTQIDDVDVVSDIGELDVDFPPRRMFKADSHNAAHHQTIRATRRAV